MLHLCYVKSNAFGHRYLVTCFITTKNTTVETGHKQLSLSLLLRRYSDSTVTTDKSCLSLLWALVATGVLTSAHPSLLDRKHNLYSVCKRKQNLHIVSERKTKQLVSSSCI
jgi:hypothetical protein